MLHNFITIPTVIHGLSAPTLHVWLTCFRNFCQTHSFQWFYSLYNESQCRLVFSGVIFTCDFTRFTLGYISSVKRNGKDCLFFICSLPVTLFCNFTFYICSHLAILVSRSRGLKFLPPYLYLCCYTRASPLRCSSSLAAKTTVLFLSRYLNWMSRNAWNSAVIFAVLYRMFLHLSLFWDR